MRGGDRGKVWVNLDAVVTMKRQADSAPTPPYTVISFIGSAPDKPSILVIEEEPAALVRSAE
jgi:hypothetical protein